MIDHHWGKVYSIGDFPWTDHETRKQIRETVRQIQTLIAEGGLDEYLNWKNYVEDNQSGEDPELTGSDLKERLYELQNTSGWIKSLFGKGK